MKKTPTLLYFFFPSLLWRENDKKNIFLTFDDGPSRKATDYILSCLERYGAKATFFCLGKQAEKYPEKLASIIEHKHQIGNHTYSHLNGWKTSTNAYLESIWQASKILKTNLFRPPFGKMTFWQYLKIKRKYKIVMWSLSSGDFDERESSKEMLNSLKRNLKYGDIVLFHDKDDSLQKLKETLPLFLEWLKKEGYDVSDPII